MNRFFKHLALGTAAVCVLAVPALAADFTHCADYLKDMGLFQGGADGYDLDRAPTRLEASVMLVRLLGAEEEAKAISTYTAPFTDVADWAKPYVQYLYDNGLSNGVGNGKFGSDSLCTAQQYTTFLLRALGYSDAAGGDFTYATAMEFARNLGLVDMLNCDENNFLRDNLAAMSFTALATKPKSGEADLLTKLVQNGAIAKDDAEMYLGFFSDYRDYAAAITKANTDAAKMSTDAGVALGMTLADMDFLTASIDMTMAMESDLEHLDQTKLAYDMNMTLQIDPTMAAAMGLPEDQATMTQNMECWYADGYYYVKSGEDKVKVALSFEDVMEQMPTSDLTATAAQVEPLCAIESLTKADNSDGTGQVNALTLTELDNSPEATFQLWFKLSSWEPATLIAQDNFSLAITQQSRMALNIGGQQANVTLGGVRLGTWTHLTVTYKDGTARAFINDRRTSVSGTLPATISATAALPDSRGCILGAGLKGQLDEIRIWNKALDEDNLTLASNLAFLHLMDDEFDEAKEWIEKCRLLAPEDRQVKAMMEEYSAKTGEAFGQVVRQEYVHDPSADEHGHHHHDDS